MAAQTFSQLDLDDLKKAKLLLENPSFAARVANLVGIPLEKAIDYLPASAKDIIVTATQTALESTLTAALSTMSNGKEESANWLHKIAAIASGAVGGAFGLPALAVELPVSTAIMFRSIADIARSEGEDIREADARLACLEVFALGGNAGGDDSTETGYFAVRAALSKALTDAAQYLAGRSAVRELAPPIVNLLSQVAGRFGLQVSEKAMAQSLPIVGAAGGAVVNALFIDHFQDVARGHFIVRRLERRYGKAEVESVYKTL